MTAKSRLRKLAHKRRNKDVDSHPRRTETPDSEAARRAEESRERCKANHPAGRGIIKEATVRSTTLVKKGTTFFEEAEIQVSDRPGEFPPFSWQPSIEEWKRHANNQEAFRAGASSDPEAVSGERIPESSEGLSVAVEDAPLTSRKMHWVYYEREVNSLPEYAGKYSCFCDIDADHWEQVKGEI